MKNQNTITSFFSWLLPTATELVAIIGFVIATLTVSNISFFSDFIFLPRDFHIKNQILDSINNLLVQVVGVNVARSAVVAIFWAFVGLLVYAAIWVILNFSDELGNDLAITKYVHPRNVDTQSPLRNFLSRISFQAGMLFVLIFYANMVVSVLLPYCAGLFRTTIRDWPTLQGFQYAILGFVTEMLVLHFLVILIRAFLLRKRVFY